jgi:eukaryotic-like serine/threonine-protein kinase
LGLGETRLAAENTTKAYELRERASESEKFYIECQYFQFAVGDLEKARQANELWAQTYPRVAGPLANLSFIDSSLGQHEKALAELREALSLEPGNGQNRAFFAFNLLNLNRLEEAQASAEETRAKKLDSPLLRTLLYLLAFLHNDTTGMAEQVVWTAGKSGWEDVMLYYDADSAAYFGRLGKARELSGRAVASAERADERETAASYEAEAAVRESLFGNAAEARRRAVAALGPSNGRDVQYGVALALGFAGDMTGAKALATDLAKRFPDNTIAKFHYLPTIRAQLALDRDDTAKAIEVLDVAIPYELGMPGEGGFTPALYPVYVRGEAYLAAHQGREAAAEFQRILDQRGIVQNEPIGALAHLGLARAHATQGDTAKAKAAYQDFLTLWKDADSDIPILKQAKAEYAKLQ